MYQGKFWYSTDLNIWHVKFIYILDFFKKSDFPLTNIQNPLKWWASFPMHDEGGKFISFVIQQD